MDFKNRLILFFILIAVIPIAALSVVFTVAVIEFKGQISNVYDGFVSNANMLQADRAGLLSIRADLVQYTAAQDSASKSSAISHMQQQVKGALSEENTVAAGGYKKIGDLPGRFSAPGAFAQQEQRQPAGSFNISALASEETILVSKIAQQWKDYSAKVDDLAILSSSPAFAQQASAAAGQLIVLTDRLVESYDALIELNGKIGDAAKAQSQAVMQSAFFYGGLASAISAACATAAAILVSKRVVLGDLVRMSKLDLVETTLRDLIGGGADSLVNVVKSQMAEEGDYRDRAPSRPEAESAVLQPDEDGSGDDVVIGAKARAAADAQSAQQQRNRQARHTRAFIEEQVMDSGEAGEGRQQQELPELKGKLVMINAGSNSRPSPAAAKALDSLFASPNLTVLTRKGSNIYHRAPGRALVWVFAQEQDSKRKGEPQRVVPAADEAKLAQAIEDIVSDNPSAVVLLDSATELIYTLGFERAFSLLRRVSEVVSSYENASVVVLINKKAHEARVIEAIAHVANGFID
ncbi:hypothetical protein [Nitrososphaera sp.]|uniref:hypothetical protein n=1 Tax=Nitrososphaera sp. TaxID=1971748 RepID=UPI00307D24A8